MGISPNIDANSAFINAPTRYESHSDVQILTICGNRSHAEVTCQRTARGRPRDGVGLGRKIEAYYLIKTHLFGKIVLNFTKNNHQIIK